MRLAFDMFTGRANPLWRFHPTTAQTVFEMIADLGLLPDGPAAPFPGRLGYRGLNFDLPTEIIQRYRVPPRLALGAPSPLAHLQLMNELHAIGGKVGFFGADDFQRIVKLILDWLNDLGPGGGTAKRSGGGSAGGAGGGRAAGSPVAGGAGRPAAGGPPRPASAPPGGGTPPPIAGGTAAIGPLPPPAGPSGGCPFEMLPYNPGPWNNPLYCPTNNCYAYAANKLALYAHRPQPGEASGQPYTALTGPDVAAAARRDGAHDAGDCFPDAEAPRLLVALVIWPGEDYHWYRKHPTCWGHKIGWDPATNLDSSNVIITDPATCDRGLYTVFHGYMLMPVSQRVAAT